MNAKDPADAVREAPMIDTFNGDNAHLIECIAALLSLDAAGALVPHGIGGHARVLLESAAVRLSALAGAGPDAELTRLYELAGYGGVSADAPERIILASSMYDGLECCDKWCSVDRVVDDGQPMPESATVYIRADLAHAPAKAREDEARRVLEWLASEDTGMSSEAIAYHMLGMYSEGSHPHDPADLGRCLRLLELFPEWKVRIGEMATYSRNWSALSERWDELSALMIDEVGIDWSKGRNAPRTYEAMKTTMRAALATFAEGSHD